MGNLKQKACLNSGTNAELGAWCNSYDTIDGAYNDERVLFFTAKGVAGAIVEQLVNIELNDSMIAESPLETIAAYLEQGEREGETASITRAGRTCSKGKGGAVYGVARPHYRGRCAQTRRIEYILADEASKNKCPAACKIVRNSFDIYDVKIARKSWRTKAVCKTGNHAF